MKCEGEIHVNEMIKVKEMKKVHQAHVSIKSVCNTCRKEIITHEALFEDLE